MRNSDNVANLRRSTRKIVCMQAFAVHADNGAANSQGLRFSTDSRSFLIFCSTMFVCSF